MCEFSIIDPFRTLVIERVRNGLVVSSFSEYNGDGIISVIRDIFETRDDLPDGEEDWDTVEEMFWHILNILGYYNNKHARSRLNIEVERSV